MLSAATPEFEPLAREATLAARVMAQLEARIVSGELAPGDRLPPERGLARSFGVSRTVVREAVTALNAKQWLESVPGGGARVRSPDAQHVSQGLTLMLRAGNRELAHENIGEVRAMLETQIVVCAAVRRDENDLAVLSAILDEMATLCGHSEAETIEKLVLNDVGFHAALADATHNALFRVLLDSVAEVMLAVRRLGLRNLENHAPALAHHRAIFAAIERGDTEAARAAMEAHLDESRGAIARAVLKNSS